MKKILSLLFMLLFSSILISCSDDNSNNQNYYPNDNPNGGGGETEPYDEYKAEIKWQRVQGYPYGADLRKNELNMNNYKIIAITSLPAYDKIIDIKGTMILPNDEIIVRTNNFYFDSDKERFCKLEQDPTNPKKYNISGTLLKGLDTCYIETMISPKKYMGKQEIKFNIHTFPQGYDNVSKPYDIVLDYTSNPENENINAGGESLDLELPDNGTEIGFFNSRHHGGLYIPIKNNTTKPVRVKWEVIKITRMKDNQEVIYFMSRDYHIFNFSKIKCNTSPKPEDRCGLFDIDEIAAGQEKEIEIQTVLDFFDGSTERKDYKIEIEMKMYHEGQPVAKPKKYWWTFYKREVY